MRLMLAAVLLLLPATVAGASGTYSGFAVRHRSLARVAALRGMDTTGVLFASPLAPLGTRLCVTSDRSPEPTCGTIVDVPQPEDHAWQLANGRIIEVSPAIARRLCKDATGLPSQCPVDVWIERRQDVTRNGVRSDADYARGKYTSRSKTRRRMVGGRATYAGGVP